MKVFMFVCFIILSFNPFSYAAEGDPVLLSYEDVNESINICVREDKGLSEDYRLTCLQDELAVVDNTLNFNYKLMVVSAKFVDRYEKNRNALNKLIESQRAWIKYRDADVKFSQNGESYYFDGEYNDRNDNDYISAKRSAEIERLIVCIIITYQRSNIFYYYLKGEGGFNYVYSLSVG